MTLPEEATAADKLKLMGIKKEVMSSVLSAGVRVNDAALRRKDDDKVAAMLKAVKQKLSPAPEPPATQEVTMDDLFG